MHPINLELIVSLKKNWNLLNINRIKRRSKRINMVEYNLFKNGEPFFFV